jgi:hypothetical protein
LHFTKPEEVEETEWGQVLNAGFYTNRRSIRNITPGEKFVLRIKALNNSGSIITNLNLASYVVPSLQECHWNTNSGLYSYTSFASLESTTYDQNSEYCTLIYVINNNAESLTEEQFLRLKLELCLQIKDELYL